MCNVLEADDPFNFKKKIKERKKKVLSVIGVESRRIELQHESSMELDLTGATPCTDDFMSLQSIFISVIC